MTNKKDKTTIAEINKLNETTDLVEFVEQSGLQENKVQELMKNYSLYFAKARQLVTGAMDIKITSEDQVDEMALARGKRLLLRACRLDVEKTRKELKAQSLREGKAIDGAANIIKALIVPVEEYLQGQEDFIKQIQENRKRLLVEKRAGQLQMVGVDGPASYILYDLGEMEEETFKHLLKTYKKARDAEETARREAEAEKAKQAEAERVEQARIKAENEALKKEKKEREDLAKAEAEEREHAENVRLEAEEKKLSAEREEKAKLQKRLDDQKEAEEAKIRAEEEVKRQALLAPDRDKLIDLAGQLRKLVMPRVESKEAGKIIDGVEEQLNAISSYLIEESKNL